MVTTYSEHEADATTICLIEPELVNGTQSDSGVKITFTFYDSFKIPSWKPSDYKLMAVTRKPQSIEDLKEKYNLSEEDIVRIIEKGYAGKNS